MRYNPCSECHFVLNEPDSLFEKCTINGECPYQYDSKKELEEEE